MTGSLSDKSPILNAFAKAGADNDRKPLKNDHSLPAAETENETGSAGIKCYKKSKMVMTVFK